MWCASTTGSSAPTPSGRCPPDRPGGPLYHSNLERSATVPPGWFFSGGADFFSREPGRRWRWLVATSVPSRSAFCAFSSSWRDVNRRKSKSRITAAYRSTSSSFRATRMASRDRIVAAARGTEDASPGNARRLLFGNFAAGLT